MVKSISGHTLEALYRGAFPQPIGINNATGLTGEAWHSFQTKKVVLFSRKQGLGKGGILSRMIRKISHRESFCPFPSDFISHVFPYMGDFC